MPTQLGLSITEKEIPLGEIIPPCGNSGEDGSKWVDRALATFMYGTHSLENTGVPRWVSDWQGSRFRNSDDSNVHGE